MANPDLPITTYRLQIRPTFDFDHVAALADYLEALGVTHVYLSPVLQPAPGSTHGYDVVDHSRLNQEAGGEEAFDRMSKLLRQHGIGCIADVVPNHMAVPTPVRLNNALWSVLRDGPGSPYARWFDVDWSVPSRALLMPVLGKRIGQVIADGELVLDTSRPEPVLRYYDHEFPVRPGTESLELEALVARQWYRLAWWRVSDDELNYRRFFDVDTLAALRVEDPEVFDRTHGLLLRLVAEGALSGLRIDHPDGLADPRGYLTRLADKTGNAWVVVEKILEGGERLPTDWPCAGTTGYDSLLHVGGLFVDPAGAAPLASLLTDLTGDGADFHAVVEAAKRDIVGQSLYAEVERLVELLVDITTADLMLRDHTRRHLREALVELLVAFGRYRAYVVPGEPAPQESVDEVERAATIAREHVPDEARDAVDAVRDLVLGRAVGHGPSGGRAADQRRELIVRFQQTCGPVMAKGVEDTAFYRWSRLLALNEVGGDPLRFGVPPEDFHDHAGRLQRDWPTAMTTLSTHDTKRSEDARARLLALSEVTAEWAEAVRAWTDLAARYHSPDGAPGRSTAYLIWQTLVSIWDDGPPAEERLVTYLRKATRENKRHTSWTDPDQAYEEAVARFVGAVLSDSAIVTAVQAFCDTLAPFARVAILGQKLVQLTMPGVPDIYQGCEIVDLSLVDPDNRRVVDFDRRRAVLAELDAGTGTGPQSLDAEKLLITHRALRLRRAHPEWFVGRTSTYAPVPTTTANVIAFSRGRRSEAVPRVVTVATRLPVAVERRGGWGENAVALPEGFWTDELTGSTFTGGSVRLAALLGELPVTLLTRA